MSRLFFDRLPATYQENDVVSWFTQPYDEFLASFKSTLDTLPTHLDPTTCDPDWLDYLAALSGFTGRYWSSHWATDVKRSLIAMSFKFLWKRRGTRAVLETVLSLFLGTRFDVWTTGEFRADITVLPGLIGDPEFRYFVRLPLDFRRDSEQFRIAALMNELYGVAACDSSVVYDGFYADFSVAGDPVFDAEDKIS